jgi:serine/threonine protein kinase
MEANFSNQQIGDFVVQEIIRQRASIDMYRATQGSLRRLVLFKVISLTSITETEHQSIDDFQAFIRSVITLEHLHLQPIYTFGVLDDKHLYVVGRMIAGSLADLLDAGALPTEQLFTLALQVASALTYIHARGFVHKSISPQNVYIGEDQNAYMNDLELAPLVQAVRSLGELEAILGEPFYAPIEQLQLQPLDVRSEIYSFGAVLYHMATGVAPFFDEDNSFEQVLERKLKSQLVPPRQLNPTTSPQLESLILRALRTNPEERFSNVSAMERELISIYQGGNVKPVSANSWLEILRGFLSRR